MENLINLTGPILYVAIGIIALLVLIVFFKSTYQKVRPNEVMIITGAGLKEPKVIKGGGALVIPVFQQWDVLDLSSFTLQLTVESNTKTQVPLVVNGTATLNIGEDAVSVETAARKFLGLSVEERDSQLSEIVKGNVRGILGDMLPEEVSNNKKHFSEKVAEDLEPKLRDLGIEVASIQINDVTDENGYLDSLYAEDVANKKASAREAEARADARARATQAEQDQIAQKAEQESAQLVAERQKETAIARAHFKEEQDRAQAKADQAYALADAEASKATILEEGEANAIRAEREAIIAEANVKTERARLESEVIAKTDAEAKAKEINADMESKTRKTLADASRYEKEQEAEAAAALVKLSGEAKAKVIREQGLAEADAKSALAKALSDQGQAVLQQLLIEKLPEIARVLAEPLSNIDNMTVFNGAEGVTNSITGNMAQTFKFVKDATGLDIADLTESKAKGTVTIGGDPIVQVGAVPAAEPKVLPYSAKEVDSTPTEKPTK